jgi:hypothetical protein
MRARGFRHGSGVSLVRNVRNVRNVRSRRGSTGFVRLGSHWVYLSVQEWAGPPGGGRPLFRVWKDLLLSSLEICRVAVVFCIDTQQQSFIANMRIPDLP